MKIAIFIIISGLLLGLVEILKRKLSLSTSVTRRMSHIGATIIAAASPLFISKTIIVVACFSFAITVFFLRKTKLLSSIHDVERTSYGDVFLPIGEAITAMLFLPTNILAFQFGVLIMGISDALAGLIGEKFGKHHIQFLNNKKSLEGSLVFFVTSLILTFFFFPIFGYQLILIPLVLTFVEFVFVFGLDNLILPMVAAFLAQLLF